MKANYPGNIVQIHTACLVLLALALVAILPAATLSLHAAPGDPAKDLTSLDSSRTHAPFPWNEIGAKAGVDYKGDGLTVTATESGAKLNCTFQKLEGEATREGLWLTSTTNDAVEDRFRIVATAVKTRDPRSAARFWGAPVLWRCGIVGNAVVNYVARCGWQVLGIRCASRIGRIASRAFDAIPFKRPDGLSTHWRGGDGLHCAKVSQSFLRQLAFLPDQPGAVPVHQFSCATAAILSSRDRSLKHGV